MAAPAGVAGGPSHQRTASLWRLVRGLALGLGITAGTVILLEGGTSLYLFVHDLRSAAAPKAIVRPHTAYDTLLGWVNRPSFSSPDEYGPGLGLTTNAQGFRGLHDADSAAAQSVVCSGDSFTLGYGVSDGHEWCALLESLLPGVQSINMGQAGYGVDQAYLWYRRDGTRYPHQIQIVALTAVQFERALTGRYLGREKPYLELQEGRLVSRNVPVPRQTARVLRWAYAGRTIEDLRVMQLIRRIPAFAGRRSTINTIAARWALFEKMFDELEDQHRANGSQLVLVYLPIAEESKPSYLDDVRTHVAEYATRRGVPFLDLTPDLRALRRDSLDLAFIANAPHGAAPGVSGHYSDLGNAWVAHLLAAKLGALLPSASDRGVPKSR